jgi:hypothetical protein
MVTDPTDLLAFYVQFQAHEHFLRQAGARAHVNPLLEASAKRILGGAQGLPYLEASGADLYFLPNKQAPTDTAGSQSSTCA